MSTGAQVYGLPKLLAQLRARQKKVEQDKDPVVKVGYTAAYAVYVHENLEAYHTVGKAKYLEDPLRLLRDELRLQIVRDVQTGMSLSKALLRAGLRLQRVSQLEVPVDTANLKNSAFTRLE